MASPLIQKFRNDTVPRLLARFDNGGIEYGAVTVTPNIDPLLPPAVVETWMYIDAVAAGTAGRYADSDPNLVASDIRVISGALDFTPVVGSYVRINGLPKLIVRVDPIIASGPPAAYRFFVR